MNKPDKNLGLAFYTPEDGIWTGSYVDTVSKRGIQLCLDEANKLADPDPIPENGQVVVVQFIINQNETDKLKKL